MKREEYLDDYQDHAERRPKKKKKKKKRKHRVYAFFVLLFAFLILVLGIFILFHVQKVEVKGNDYCSTEEIVKSVQNDKYSVNGLYVLAKYKLGYGKQPDCFESIKVSLKNPWTLKITVQEKERIGYVMDSDGKYYYFDQDGMVVDVEEAPVDVLFYQPAHPYTKGLIASVPKLGSGVKVLPSIPGSVPDLSSLPEGCRFAPRCAFATERCRKEKPDLYPVGEGQRSRCFLAENAGKGEK